jgi:hypothetical protein
LVVVAAVRRAAAASVAAAAASIGAAAEVDLSLHAGGQNGNRCHNYRHMGGHLFVALARILMVTKILW